MGKIKYNTRNQKKANGRFNKTKKNKRIYSGGKTAVKPDDKPAVKPVIVVPVCPLTLLIQSIVYKLGSDKPVKNILPLPSLFIQLPSFTT